MSVEDAARQVFAAAIDEGCAELLDALFKGGTATVDAATGKLIIVDDEFLRQLAEGL